MLSTDLRSSAPEILADIQSICRVCRYLALDQLRMVALRIITADNTAAVVASVAGAASRRSLDCAVM